METTKKYISIKYYLAKFFHLIWQVLAFFIKVWADTPTKEYEPTMRERICGRKLFSSGEYYMPNQKTHQ